MSCKALQSIDGVSWANKRSLLFKSAVIASSFGCKPASMDETDEILDIGRNVRNVSMLGINPKNVWEIDRNSKLLRNYHI